MTIKIYLLNAINAAWQLAVSENKTICNRAGWLERVGVASMTETAMRTLVEREDIDGFAIDFLNVYEAVLGRKLSTTEGYDVLAIYFSEKKAHAA